MIFDIEKKKDRVLRNSINRSKNAIYEYSRANSWEYFITLTFNKQKINRYDYDEVSRKVGKWLNNARSRLSKDLKYIIVPELHKDGAYHLHGLLANTGDLKFIDSGIKNNGHIVYNISNFNLGFTTATTIIDTLKASNYITKYITKELAISTYGKNRYWVSRNLDKPIVEELYLSDEMVSDLKMKYVGNTKYYKSHTIDVKGYKNVIDYIII